MQTSGAILSNGKRKRLFFIVDVKSKQRYKVKVILFSLSLLNKEELKA